MTQGARYTAIVDIRFRPDQLELVDETAALMQQSRSEFVRDLVLRFCERTGRKIVKRAGMV